MGIPRETITHIQSLPYVLEALMAYTLSSFCEGKSENTKLIMKTYYLLLQLYLYLSFFWAQVWAHDFEYIKHLTK